ncbi:MAG: hypothetical protein ABI411_12150 [Tahibacter sp.]
MTNKIALVGASQAEEGEFRSLLGPAAARLKQRWELVAEPDADLVVVDVDSIFGHMAWLKAHGAGKRTAALTDRVTARESDLVLQRPLSADAIAELLTRYGQDMPERHFEPPTEPVAAAPPPRVIPTPAPPRAVPVRPPAVSPPTPTPVAAPEPVMAAPPPTRDSTLIDFLTGASLLLPARLQTAGAPDLVLDPATQSYHAAGAGLRALTPHCQRLVRKADWQEMSKAELDHAKAVAPAQPYSRLLWFYTLAVSNGQMLPGLDANARYKLNKWPQIEREFAKHFRIATFMLKQLSTLPEIVDGSGATLADVIDFVNAYDSIGFVDNDIAKPADPADATKGGMLSRLRNPFGR